MATIKETSYWLDTTLRIVRVSPDWDQFAVENDGNAVVAARVVNQPLQSFIIDDTTYRWTHTLIMRVWLTGEPVVRPYRCDAPALKRFMKMTIRLLEGNYVCLTHEILRTEPIAPSIYYTYAPYDLPGRLLRCSVCNRLRVNSQWVEGTQVEPDEWTAGPKIFKVYYSICNDCRTAVSTSFYFQE